MTTHELALAGCNGTLLCARTCDRAHGICKEVREVQPLARRRAADGPSRHAHLKRSPGMPLREGWTQSGFVHSLAGSTPGCDLDKRPV